jgi:hypothetical protein
MGNTYHRKEEQGKMKRYKNITLNDEQKYIRMLCELTKTDNFYHSTYESFIGLARVMNKFPKFVWDLSGLFYHKIITYDDNRFKWNLDNTSLAQYFKNLDKKSGDFWGDIEAAFSIKEGSLRHLASSNGGIDKPSKGYEKLQSFFPTKEEEKYIDKFIAIEKIVNDDTYWKKENDYKNLTECYEAIFADIKKIIDG